MRMSQQLLAVVLKQTNYPDEQQRKRHKQRQTLEGQQPRRRMRVAREAAAHALGTQCYSAA